MPKKILSISAMLAFLFFSLPQAAAAAGVYTSSTLGYDVSYNALSYPATHFNFGIVGVTRGKAFTDNSRLVSEYSWARIGSSVPTIYMNLNAPYGSTVAGHIGSPKSCPQVVASAEPTACEGYNYGYNAAAHSYAYAKSQNVTSPFWWLDIEEANSWSATSAVNDATIQGAIDYLNAQGVRAGVYSTPRMWRNIAGSNFVPAQAMGGQTFSTPVWLPIGITNQIGATNACVTRASFIPGNPIWLMQYETSSTAIDQNYAC